jgi:hypothetical protein
MGLQAQRTLVKSQPELWAELSDVACLARHLGELGEIRITRLDPERAVEWEAERASGTVALEPSGWGTRVTITAHPAAEPAAEPPPTLADAVAALMAETRPAELAEAPESSNGVTDEARAPGSSNGVTDEDGAPGSNGVTEEAGPESEPAIPGGGRWTRLWSRMRRRPAPADAILVVRPVEQEPAPEPGPEPEPVAAAPVEPEPAPPPEPEPEPVDEELLSLLKAALDSLGTAHHRPFSRP